MSLIDQSYFKGELLIPHLTQAVDIAALQLLIDAKESELLTKLLGYELYKLYVAGITANTQKYKDIRDGKEYTNSSGSLTKWVGLAFTVGTIKKSLIANYVYCCYQINNYTFTTGSGEKKTDLAINALPEDKVNRAWNEMVSWNVDLYEFLSTNKVDYPEYVKVIIDSELYNKKNRFNI